MSSQSKESAKKLVSVLATSTPITRIRKEAVQTAEATGKDGKESKSEYLENLAQVLCIWYPITFRKKFMPISMLIDLNSEVNVIYLTFA